MMQVADNSLKTVNNIEELKSVRVTQVANFSKCPARWMAELTGKGIQTKSKYADIGTALHAVIERYLRGDLELFTAEWEQQMMWLDSVGVPPKERLALISYITRHLASIRNVCFSIEDEFRLKLVPDAPDIVGHRDCLFYSESGGIIIRDHKSNRQFDGVEYWRHQFQPLLYALGTAHQYPGRTITFEIGYILLGEVVRWEITPAEMLEYEKYLTAKYAEMWEEIRIYKRTGHWPERINPGCYHCPVREQCPTLIWTHKDFIWSIEGKEELSLTEKYEWARDVQASINAKVDELKAAIIEDLKQKDGEAIYIGSKLYSLGRSKRREVKWPALYSALLTTYQKLPAEQQAEVWARLWERLGDIVSVKIGELSDFLIEYPQFREETEKIIETVESENLSLQVKQKGPV